MNIKKHFEGENGINAVWSIAYPMIISNASHSIIIFFDRVFLSKLSIEALAASMPGALTAFMFLAFFTGLTSYVNALSAQYFGAKQYSKCGATLWQGIYISFVSYIILLFAIPLGIYLFNFFNFEPEVLKLTKIYFTIIMLGILFPLLNNTFSSFFASIGKTKIIMIANITSMIVNLPLNLILIFGIPENNIYNFQGWGIRGAAIASIISTIIGVSIYIKVFFNHYYKTNFATNKEYKINISILKKLFKHGGHTGIEFLLHISAFNIFILMSGSIGIVEQAAVNITFSWNLLAFLPLIGIAIATTSLVGKNIGGGNIKGAEESLYSALKIGYFFITIVAIIYFLMPEILVNIFSSTDPGIFSEVKSVSTIMIRRIVVFIFADVILVVCSGALKGAGDTKFIMISSTLGHWLLLVFPTAIAIYYFQTGLITIWIIFIVFSVLLATLYLYRYKSGKWKNIKLIDELNVPVQPCPGEIVEVV